MAGGWRDLAGKCRGCERAAWREGLCGPCWTLADDARIARELQAAQVGDRVELAPGFWIVKTGPGDYYARRPGALDFGE